MTSFICLGSQKISINRRLKKMLLNIMNIRRIFNVNSQVPRIAKKDMSGFKPINRDFHCGSWHYVINDAKLARYLFSQKTLKNRRQMLSDMEPNLAFANEDKMWSVRRIMVLKKISSFLDQSYLGDIFESIINDDLIPHLKEQLNTHENWYGNDFITYLLFKFGISFVFGLSSNKLTFNSRISQKYLDLMPRWLDTRLPALNLSSFPYSRCFPKFFDYLYGNPIKKHELLTKEIYDIFLDNFIIPSRQDFEGNHSYFKAIYNDSSMLLNEEQIISDIFTLFIGFHATSYTVQMGILLAAKYPRIQQEIYESLNVSGKQKNKLLDAFIAETLRIDSVISSIERVTTDDIEIKLNKENILFNNYPDYLGKRYLVPKNSVVHINSTLMQNSNVYWKNPDKMDLNHWLKDKDSKKCDFIKRKQNMPFGVGVRACIGQNLANKILKVLFSNIFKNFEIKAPCANPEVNFNISINNSFVRSLNDLGVIIRNRES